MDDITLMFKSASVVSVQWHTSTLCFRRFN